MTTGSPMTTKPDNMPQVARFWNDVAHQFDAIYTGQKSAVGRALDKWFRRDIYQRFDWVMAEAGDVRGKTICDIGCGSGRFVTALAQRGAAHVTGVDVAPEMLKIARGLVEQDGVADRCDFVHADVQHWKTDQQFDLTIAIGFWDYIQDPTSRLQVIRSVTRGRFLSACRGCGRGGRRSARCASTRSAARSTSSAAPRSSATSRGRASASTR